MIELCDYHTSQYFKLRNSLKLGGVINDNINLIIQDEIMNELVNMAKHPSGITELDRIVDKIIPAREHLVARIYKIFNDNVENINNKEIAIIFGVGIMCGFFRAMIEGDDNHRHYECRNIDMMYYLNNLIRCDNINQEIYEDIK